jgi:hypothetical protein
MMKFQFRERSLGGDESSVVPDLERYQSILATWHSSDVQSHDIQGASITSHID